VNKTTMQAIIDNEYGTFLDDSHEVYLIADEELARSMVMLSSSRVHSFETGGGMMFDWVPCVIEEDE
jgi:hypothetical protein